MSGRSSHIPEDEKLEISSDSPWRKYPTVFGVIGVVALLLSFVISTAGEHEGESHAEGAAQHQVSAHGSGSPASSSHHDADDADDEGDDHGSTKADGEAEHGAQAAHGDDGHGEKSHAKGEASHGDESHGAGHSDEGEHGGHHGPPGPRFWFSYLTAFMFTLSIALGGLFFVAIQFLTKSGWSVSVRRVAENIMGTLPLFAGLFVIVAMGLSVTHFHWWDVPVGEDPLLDGKRGYLNHQFFFIRAIIYLAIWSGLALYFRRASLEQDQSGDHDITRRLQTVSPVAVMLFALTLTFAAIDWMKTMDPHWYSTMWGVYYFAGTLVAIFSSLSLFVLWLQRDGYLQTIVNPEHYHDLGKQMFGFNVFWTYIAFSQYFLIWYANLPEEQLWFDHRAHGGWREYGIFLAVGHFFIPFFFLLPRAIKRNPVTLCIGAVWLLFIHYVDIYFIVMPVYSSSFSPSIVDLLALVGVVGLFLAVFTSLVIRSPLIPIKDPRLPIAVAFENH